LFNFENYFIMKKVATFNEKGCFGAYGGMFVPEVLESKLNNLFEQFKILSKDENFKNEFTNLLKNFILLIRIWHFLF